MHKKRASQPAVLLNGYCDLTGKPCLPGIHLLQSMMHAVRSIGDALPDDFTFEAEVDIETCPRTCRLSLVAEGRAASVSCGANPLAEVIDDEMPGQAFRLCEFTDLSSPVSVRRAH